MPKESSNRGLHPNSHRAQNPLFDPGFHADRAYFSGSLHDAIDLFLDHGSLPRWEAVEDGIYRETAKRVEDIQSKGFDNAKVQHLLRCLQTKEIPSSAKTLEFKELLENASGNRVYYSYSASVRYYTAVDLYVLSQNAFRGCDLQEYRDLEHSLEYFQALTYSKTARSQHNNHAASSRIETASSSDQLFINETEVSNQYNENKKKTVYHSLASKRHDYQFNESNHSQPDFVTRLKRMLIDENVAFQGTKFGIAQIYTGLDRIAIQHRLREVIAFSNNHIHGSIDAPLWLTAMSPSIVDYDDSAVHTLKASLISNLPPYFHDTSSDKKSDKSTVWIIFIRISKKTANDGYRQLFVIIAVFLYQRHQGHDIELLPYFCYGRECNKFVPWENDAFMQLIQLVCSPRLANRDIRAIVTEPLRFCLNPSGPNGREAMQDCIDRLHPSCELQSLFSLVTEIKTLHELSYQHYREMQILNEKVSAQDITQILQPDIIGTKQEEIFELAAVIRSEWDDSSLRTIAECTSTDIFTSDQRQIMISEFHRCLNMVRDGATFDNAISSFFGVIDSLKWQIPSKFNETVAVIYIRLSTSLSHTFRNEFENAVDCMGESASLASPSQLANCLACIQQNLDTDVLGSQDVVIFVDYAVPRRTVAKRKLLECIVFSHLTKPKMAVTNQMSRVGSDALSTEMQMLMIDGGVGRFEVASQVDYDFRQLINAEDRRKLEQAIMMNEYKCRTDGLLKDIGEEEAKEQQRINKLAGMQPQVNDLEVLKNVLAVKHEHRVNLPDDVLELLKPVPLRILKPNRQSRGKITYKIGAKPEKNNTSMALLDITNTKRSREGAQKVDGGASKVNDGSSKVKKVNDEQKHVYSSYILKVSANASFARFIR